MASASARPASDPVGPRRDVTAAGLTEVEQHRPGVVEQLEDTERAVGAAPGRGRHEVQIGYPASEQRMALAELVADVQPGDEPGEPSARLVHARQL